VEAVFLEAGTGVEALAGVERFLDRIAKLREGQAVGITPEKGQSALALLALRKIIDAPGESQLRTLIETVRRGAQPDEVVVAPPMDPRRLEVAQRYITWLHEWREVARVSIARRDYRIALRNAAELSGADHLSHLSAPIGVSMANPGTSARAGPWPSRASRVCVLRTI
jgi:hypothetical protein